MKEVILVCNDLFGIEVLELVNQINIYRFQKCGEPEFKVVGYLSEKDNPFGDINISIRKIGSIYDWKPSSNERFILGMNKPEEKLEVVNIMKGKGACFQTIIAPWTIAPALEIGEGSVISAYTIMKGIEIGKYVTVIGAMLSGYRIGDYSTVLRFSNIAGETIGRCSYIGNHVFLAVGKKIGDYCTVGDGSIVVKNVKSGLSVSGVPAKIHKA